MVGYLFMFFSILNQSSFALDFQSSRTLSLGQSGRGGALLGDTITTNPSLLGFQPVASASGTFNWLNQPNGSGNNFNVSVIDGKNPYLNAGVSFTRRKTIDLIHVSVAKRVTPWLSVGASGKRLATRSNSEAAAGNAYTGYDAGISTSVAIPPSVSAIPLQFGLAADNIANKVSHEPYVGSRQVGAGVKATFSSAIVLYGDIVRNFSPTKGNYPFYAGGLEVAMMGDLFLRGGIFGLREKGWSAGAGWVGPKLALGYGYQSRKIDTDKSFEHAVTMDIFM